MTRDEIIRMAQECNLIGMRPHLDGIYQESLERFAALVAAARQPLTADQLIKAAQASLSPDQYEHFEAMAENQPDIYERLAKSIEAQR